MFLVNAGGCKAACLVLGLIYVCVPCAAAFFPIWLSVDQIALRDLKRCGNAKVFFDFLFNINKFFENEHLDPLSKVGKLC